MWKPLNLNVHILTCSIAGWLRRLTWQFKAHETPSKPIIWFNKYMAVSLIVRLFVFQLLLLLKSRHFGDVRFPFNIRDNKERGENGTRKHVPFLRSLDCFLCVSIHSLNLWISKQKKVKMMKCCVFLHCPQKRLEEATLQYIMDNNEALIRVMFRMRLNRKSGANYRYL